MGVKEVKDYLAKFGKDQDVKEYEMSSATVELAAQAIGTDANRIAKTISFVTNDGIILIVCSGNTKIDNPKYKKEFGCKAKMLPFSEVKELIGHEPGGICPFAIKEDVKVYLDESLKRFEYSYPAAGESNACVKLTLDDFERCSQNFVKWIDVCKIPE